MRKLEYFENELNQSATGRELLSVIMDNIEEINYLINKNRQVMVTWNRNKGPAFIASFVESGFEPNVNVKKEIEGIKLMTLLRRMAVVIQEHGSYRIKKTVSDYSLLVLNMANQCNSLTEVFARIRGYDNRN